MSTEAFATGLMIPTGLIANQLSYRHSDYFKNVDIYENVDFYKNVDIKFSAHDAFLELRSKSKDWKAK